MRAGASVYDLADPMGKMFFNVLATFAEFEADLIRMRTREGGRLSHDAVQNLTGISRAFRRVCEILRLGPKAVDREDHPRKRVRIRPAAKSKVHV